MPVESKRKILSRHPYLRLSLSHAAIGTYPCHSRSHVMMVNRLILIFEDSGNERSSIRDAVSKELFQMQPGWLYFVPCHHPSDWDFSPNLRFISLHFNLELFYGFDVFRDFRRCFSCEASERAIELKTLIHHDEEILTLSQINEIIYHLCTTILNQQPKACQHNNKWEKYENIFNYIRKSGDATTTVEQLATMMNVRNNVFSRNFTRDIGITPKNFLLNTLTRKASELLLIQGTTVKQTAERLNFSSEYYFSAFFKKQTGVSPKEFQRNNGLS